MMVDDPLDEIEDAPAHEDPAGQRPRCPPRAPRCGQAVAEHSERQTATPRQGMEEPVPQRVPLEAQDTVDGVVGGAGRYMTPVQDLVQHDAVDETAEAAR